MLIPALLVVSLLQAPAGSTGLSVTVAPGTPWIEQDPSAPTSSQFLNFDFLIANGGGAPRTLAEVRLSVFDPAHQLVLRRFCDGSGISPCNATLPDRLVPAGGSVILYNPFHTLPGDLRLGELNYELVFADSAGIEVDTVSVAVHPSRPPATPALLVPVTGRLLVFDGHDSYSHHRRWNLAHPVIKMVGFTGNSGRYAYDLSRIDSTGAMYKGDGKLNSDWYSWEAPVRAPAAGTVVAVANDQTDWEIGRTSLPDSVIMSRPLALYGNYIIIDHGRGVFSLIAHMRLGSVTRKVGDRVTAGQQVGKVGFSGSVYTIHTHFQLQSGPEYFAEGLPSYFINASRVGAPNTGSTLLRIDSGDLVVSR